MTRQAPGDPVTVATILAGLPEWFGVPDATAAYAEAARTTTTLAARRHDGEVVGVALIAQHFPESAEIHLLAVARPWHRHGVGRTLLGAAETHVRALGAKLLMVRTLGPSDPDPAYAATRAFYLATGFVPMAELEGIWPDSPCLILVKPLTRVPDIHRG